MARIQIKPIALELTHKRMPEFAPMAKKAGYWFRRERRDLYDIFIISASYKYGSVEVDIYTGVFPDWPGNYGTHLVRSGKRLDNLRYDSHAIDVDDVGYRHDQTEEGIRYALGLALDDIERFALPFFADFQQHIVQHSLTVAAFGWIAAHQDEIPLSVGPDVASELEEVGRYRMANPCYIALRDHLRAIDAPDISRDDRKEISTLVIDLLQLYSETEGNIQQPATGA